MAIDPTNETLVSLADAARLLPRRRGGRKVHTSTCYRWTVSGCKGVLLESVQIGGTRCTSKEALARFFQRLTEANASTRESPRSPARRRRAAEQAEQQLEREGV
jgi:hypothetical protein